MIRKIDRKTIKIKTLIVFIITFLVIQGCVCLLNKNQEKQEKIKAEYTAESTISRVESQLNKYLAESNLIKRTIEAGYDMDEKSFATVSQLMRDETGVIEAHELAKDGVVNQAYPLKGNEEAIGLDMLQNPARVKEARLAKKSGKYTIAGPYELVQGGTGSLLFDPIYRTDENGKKEFWGFSILVMNWEKFMKEIELEKLEEAGYYYQIWKKDLYNGEKIVIAESKKLNTENSMRVKCSVPNDTWYFEIVPQEGWITFEQILFGIIVGILVAGMLAACYYQFEIRRYKDYMHEVKLQKAVDDARAANEAKTRFLFNMSHDIRTPMNAIMGFSELLKTHIDEKERALDYIEKIHTSSTFLLSIINYVLEMARIESGEAALKTEEGNFEELVHSLQAVFEPTVNEKHLEYTCTLDVQHKYVICDKTKVREIILNIVSNSLKYTPEGGKVAFNITEEPSEHTDESIYKIVVEDTGIGMSKEYLPHIYEEFTREHSTTESKVIGTGLGLPIVKSLVDLMNGTIDVESELGKGTRFEVRLPLKTGREDNAFKQEERDIEGNIEQVKGMRILLAEDNDLNAEIACTILTESGMEVERAEDGRVCLQMLKERPKRYYDAVLMDIQMPNMDGYETAKAIRSLDDSRARIPVIAMTANAFDEDRMKAFEAGMDAHVAKPIDINILMHTLKGVLR
mgnify:FL=1